jgi:hypothetical protein
MANTYITLASLRKTISKLNSKFLSLSGGTIIGTVMHNAAIKLSNSIPITTSTTTKGTANIAKIDSNNIIQLGDVTTSTNINSLTNITTNINKVSTTIQTTSNGTTYPVSKVTGQLFFNTNVNLPVWYNGSSWILANNPISSIASAPTYKGQMAIIGNIIYIATGTSSVSNWVPQGYLDQNGNIIRGDSSTVITTSTTLTAGKFVINQATSIITMTLPAMTTGAKIIIKNDSTYTANIAYGSAQIVRQNTQSTSLVSSVNIAPGETVYLQSSASYWYIVSSTLDLDGSNINQIGQTGYATNLNSSAQPTWYNGTNTKTFAMLTDTVSAASSFLTRTDNITSTTDDTTTNWAAKGPGTWYYSTLGQLNSQPSQYGHLINMVSGTSECSQLWITSNSTSVYVRGGNGGGWANSFTRLALTTEMPNTNISAGTLNISGGSSNVWSATGTIPLPSGYTRDQCKYSVWMNDWNFNSDGGTAHPYLHVNQSSGVITVGNSSSDNRAVFGTTNIGYLCVAVK